MNLPTATLDHLEISVDGVCKRLKAIKADKSPGPDALNPAFLKALAECLAALMTKIYKSPRPMLAQCSRKEVDQSRGTTVRCRSRQYLVKYWNQQ